MKVLYYVTLAILAVSATLTDAASMRASVKSRALALAETRAAAESFSSTNALQSLLAELATDAPHDTKAIHILLDQIEANIKSAWEAAQTTYNTGVAGADSSLQAKQEAKAAADTAHNDAKTVLSDKNAALYSATEAKDKAANDLASAQTAANDAAAALADEQARHTTNKASLEAAFAQAKTGRDDELAIVKQIRDLLHALNPDYVHGAPAPATYTSFVGQCQPHGPVCWLGNGHGSNSAAFNGDARDGFKNYCDSDPKCQAYQLRNSADDDYSRFFFSDPAASSAFQQKHASWNWTCMGTTPAPTTYIEKGDGDGSITCYAKTSA